MSLYYFDTSALVKYYVTEPGSTWVRQLVDQTDANTGQPVSTVFMTEISFVSGDKQQLTAAEIEGLAVENPFDRLSPTDTPPSI